MLQLLLSNHPLGWGFRLKIVLDASRALAYLHERQLVHRLVFVCYLFERVDVISFFFNFFFSYLLINLILFISQYFWWFVEISKLPIYCWTMSGIARSLILGWRGLWMLEWPFVALVKSSSLLSSCNLPSHLFIYHHTSTVQSLPTITSHLPSIYHLIFMMIIDEYMAPELLFDEDYGPPADVFSFGMV